MMTFSVRMKVYIVNVPYHTRIIKYSLIIVTAVLVIVVLKSSEREHNQDRRYSDIYLKKEMDHSQRNVLCVSFTGRLGNIMFQYASAFGIAKQKNMTLHISEHDRISQIFNTSARKMKNEKYCETAFKKYENIHCAYDPELLNFTQNYVKLYDYLQSWKYFAPVVAELRYEFRFRSVIMTEAKNLLQRATRNSMFHAHNSIHVGVHIRRGDMFYAQIRNESRVSGYNVAPLTYIKSAIVYFKKRFPKITFVICSDDIRWAVMQLGRYQKLWNLVFIHKEPELDMAVLGLCNHTIMTTGTFGWWAAFLAGGTTIYYKHYVKEDSFIRKQFSADFSDFFYPGWIPME